METAIFRLSTMSDKDVSCLAHVAVHASSVWHKHEFYELVYVLEGYCLHHMGDSVSLVMEGDLFLIKPGVRHRYAGTKEFKIYNCVFLADCFREDTMKEMLTLNGMGQFFSEEPDAFPQMHLDLNERKSVRRTMEQLSAECRDYPQGWQLRMRALMESLMVECSRIYVKHGSGHQEKDSYFGYVMRALHYIDENYAKDSLTVKEIGNATGVSGDYLSRQFRRVTGIAVQEYVRRYRFARAIAALQQGCSVGEAARQSGFHSISYFSREFKKEMGVMPSHYQITNE